jgi:polyhydroxybutyrate depolymerase
VVGAPLVVVFAPAVASASDTEGFIGLTPDATARGFIVAYVDHIAPGSSADVADAASVVERVASRWCVDPARVYLTGHSDGATLCWFIAQRGLATITAIAPSAAGVRIDSESPPDCPKHLVPAMVVHGKRDAVFPIAKGYGSNVAAWWAKCSGCASDAPAPDANGCVSFGSCPAAAEVRYCEWGGAHPNWPPLNGAMLDFFERWPTPR